jgi:ketosteroid isomerase-like protein
VSRETVELATAAFDALRAGGVEGLLPYCDPEIEWISIPGFLPDAVDRQGHEGVRSWFAQMEELFEDVSWEPEEFVDAGERIVVGATVAGRGRGSGIPVEARLFMVVSVRAGLAVRLESYLDRREAFAAAGLAG